MTALTRFFFRAPYQAPTTWSVVTWWESRRPTYNAAVGAAGLLSLGVVSLAEALAPNSHGSSIPWGGVVLWGIGANLCYCLGPALDAIICRRWGVDYAAVGPTIFRYGFVFAVGLTLLPVPLAIISCVIRWGVFILGGSASPPV